MNGDITIHFVSEMPSETRMVRGIQTHANRASTIPSITNGGAAPRVASHKELTNEAHISIICFGEQARSTTPMCPPRREDELRVRESAICCSAIRRTPILLVIAASKNAEIVAESIYRAHSAKLGEKITLISFCTHSAGITFHITLWPWLEYHLHAC